MKFHRLEKALIISAFFIACSIFPMASTAAQSQSPLFCPQFKTTESATIRYIHDGDTLILSDKRKVRLIGIDTPELARKKRYKYLPEQPFALEARDYARRLIQLYGSHVQLMQGVEKSDHYERQLYHVQLSDGSLLQSHLLAAGLATAYTTPPNQRLSNCYQQTEKTARSNQLKIWRHSKYQKIDADKLSKAHKGFHIISGKVQHIGESKKAYWLNFQANFSARIDKRDLKYFKQPLQQFLKEKVIVRGWVRHYHNKAQISLRHTTAIHIEPH